jgi:hypothetical protein
MSNPWSNSIEDVALQPLRRLLDNDHRVTSVALAEQKLDSDPNDLITKMRLADRATENYLISGQKTLQGTLCTEAILANELANELTTQMQAISKYLEEFNEQDTLKLALLEAIKSCSAHKEEMTVVNRAKLIDCLRTVMETIPELYRKANVTPGESNLSAITAALEVLQSNDVVSHEDLYGYIEVCTIGLDAVRHNRQ